jgi:hypothetical protein
MHCTMYNMKHLYSVLYYLLYNFLYTMPVCIGSQVCQGCFLMHKILLSGLQSNSVHCSGLHQGHVIVEELLEAFGQDHLYTIWQCGGPVV